MTDATPPPHEPVPQPTAHQPIAAEPTTDPPAPAAPTRPGWRNRRVSLVAATAALVVGCLLGAGVAVAAVAVTDGSSHGGGEGMERSGDRHGEGGHQNIRHGDGRDQQDGDADGTAPATPSATTPADTASPSAT